MQALLGPNSQMRNAEGSSLKIVRNKFDIIPFNFLHVFSFFLIDHKATRR